MSDRLREAIQASMTYPGRGFVFHCTDALMQHDVIDLAAQRLDDLIRPHNPAVLATCGTAGLILATALRVLKAWPVMIVRKATRFGRIVEGAVTGPARAVFVDDVIHSGNTLCYAREKLRDRGVDVVAAVCLVDFGCAPIDDIPIAGVYPHRSFRLQRH